MVNRWYVWVRVVGVCLVIIGIMASLYPVAILIVTRELKIGETFLEKFDFIFSFVRGIAFLLLGVMMLRFRLWTLKALIFLLILHMGWFTFIFFRNSEQSLLYFSTPLLIWTSLLYFITRPKVKEQFKE